MSFLYGGVSFSISLNLILAPVPYATPKRPMVRATAPRSSTWIVLNCILFVIVLDFCCVSIGDLTRDCLVFLKDRQVSSFGCFVFEIWVLRFRVSGALFSRFGCFVFEIWVLRFRVLGSSFSRFGCSVFEFRVLCFRDLGAPFSSFGCSVFKFWVLHCRVLGASFLRLGCFVLQSFRFRVLHFQNYH